MGYDACRNTFEVAVAGTYQGGGNFGIDVVGPGNVTIEGLAGAPNTVIDCLQRGQGISFSDGAPNAALLKGQPSLLLHSLIQMLPTQACACANGYTRSI